MIKLLFCSFLEAILASEPLRKRSGGAASEEGGWPRRVPCELLVRKNANRVALGSVVPGWCEAPGFGSRGAEGRFPNLLSKRTSEPEGLRGPRCSLVGDSALRPTGPLRVQVTL